MFFLSVMLSIVGKRLNVLDQAEHVKNHVYDICVAYNRSIMQKKENKFILKSIILIFTFIFLKFLNTTLIKFYLRSNKLNIECNIK